MKLSRERERGVKEIMLRGQTVAKELGGGPSVTHGFEPEPCCSGRSSTEEGAEDGRGGKEQGEPAGSQRRQVAEEVEEAQLSPFGAPHRGAERGTERAGAQHEEQASLEITERAGHGFSWERG